MTKFILKLLLTLGALWFAFSMIEWSELRQAYARQEHAYLLLAGLLLLLQTFFGSLRWYYLQRALHPSSHRVMHTFVMYYAANFFNICMPSTIGGDVARILLARGEQVPVKDVIYVVLIDRVMSLISLSALVAGTLFLLFDYLGLSAAAGSALGISYWLLLLGGLWFLRKLLPLLMRLLPFALLRDIFAAIARVADKHWHVLASLLCGIFAHIGFATAAYGLALSLQADISWLACVTLVPLVMFVSSLPISFGGWGIREMGMTAALALVGVPAAQAVLIALQIGLMGAFMGLFGGLLYLIHRPKPV